MQGVIPAGTVVRYSNGDTAVVARTYPADAEVIAVIPDRRTKYKGFVTNPARWCGYRGHPYMDWHRIGVQRLNWRELVARNAANRQAGYEPPVLGEDNVKPTRCERLSADGYIQRPPNDHTPKALLDYFRRQTRLNETRFRGLLFSGIASLSNAFAAGLALQDCRFVWLGIHVVLWLVCTGFFFSYPRKGR